MHVTLQEILASREARASTQAELLKKHRAPLLCFTMNIAGPVKTSPLIERAFGEGVRLIEELLTPCEVLERREEHTSCGPVAFWVIHTDAGTLKKHVTEIEEEHALGRLFDMDVIAANGSKLSRQGERGCMICGAPGRVCAAGRLHPVSELAAFTNGRISDYFLALDAQRIALLAKESLLREVYTAPKPGLVDPMSRGSHTDMSVADFERSAAALEPYFFACVRAGAAAHTTPDESLFEQLRALGIEAEARMYAATNGVNTHKGAIFSMGILAGAIGHLIRPDGYLPTTDEILPEAASIARTAIERDLACADGSTAGSRAYLALGERGIRGEVLDGFPSLKKISIPVYKKALASQKTPNDAGVLTLLHLIASVYDTNLYKRGGEAGVAYAREYARTLLASNDPSEEQVRQMDAALTERNLSPGGCADLLALTYFLVALEDERARTTPR